MEALSSSETSVLKRATRRNIQGDAIRHGHRRETLKSYKTFLLELLQYVVPMFSGMGLLSRLLSQHPSHIKTNSVALSPRANYTD
jgi:hypothetical protein